MDTKPSHSRNTNINQIALSSPVKHGDIGYVEGPTVLQNNLFKLQGIIFFFYKLALGGTDKASLKAENKASKVFLTCGSGVGHTVRKP